MKISKDKRYRTKTGHNVRIYATDGGGEYPVHGAFLDHDGEWEAEAWMEDGRYLVNEHGGYDLVEVAA